MLNRANTPSCDSFLFFVFFGQVSCVVVNSCAQFSQPHCALFPWYSSFCHTAAAFTVHWFINLPLWGQVQLLLQIFPLCSSPHQSVTLWYSSACSDPCPDFFFQLRLCVTYLIAMIRIFDQKNLRKKAFILAASGFTVRCGGGRVWPLVPLAK